MFTQKEYQDAPLINLQGGNCKKCNKLVEDVRGYVTQHQNCTEAKFAGTCHTCKLITTFQYRTYDDGRILKNTQDGWKQLIQQNWCLQFLNKFFK